MSRAVDVNYSVNPMVTETVRAAGRSFLVGFAVNALRSGMNYTQGVAGGCVSVIAALVDSVVKVLLLNLFGPSYSSSMEEVVVRNVVVFATVTAAATALAPTMGIAMGIDLGLTFYWRCLGVILGGQNSFLQNVVVV